MPDDDELKVPLPVVEPLILPRRRALPARDVIDEKERTAELADLADSVKALSDRLTLGAGSPAPAATESAARASRRWKRTHEPELGNVGGDRSEARVFMGAPGAPVRTGLARKPRRKAAPKSKLGVWLAGQAFCLALLALGYFVGQLGGDDPTPAANARPAASSTPARPALSPRGVSEAAFQTVNTAMAAARAGNGTAARQTLESAQRQDLAIPGLDYRLALLAIERADLAEVKLRLDSSLASGQEVAACCYVRAMLAGTIGDYSRASEECSRAAYAEPFNARYLFFWAECLRRNGRLQPAIERFEEALVRPLSPPDREYIAFKLRLAKLEAGNAAEFTGDLARQLKAEPADPRWLLTAAAMALEVGDASGAAALYQRASKVLTAGTFDMYIRDYLLITHSTEKEIAPFYRRGVSPVSPSPNVSVITVDPISWTLESADPAAWPAAARAR